MKQNKTYRLLAAGFFIIMVLAIGLFVYCDGNFSPASIYGQSGEYVVTVIGSNNNKPVYGANIQLLDPTGTGDWLNLGVTNMYGQMKFSGWETLTLKAVYQGKENTGVLANIPQTLTITLPVDGYTYTPPATQAPAVSYSFSLDVSPRESGVIGVQGPDGAMIKESYPTGTVLTLTANPVTPYQFQSFTVNGQTFTSSTLQITIDAATNVRANFVSTEPTPTQTVTLTVDKSTVSVNEQVYFTVSTNPKLADKSFTLKAYVDGEQVAFSGIEGGQTASNGMALITAVPSSVTGADGGVVTWKATVGGIDSNNIAVSVNPQATTDPANPDATPDQNLPDNTTDKPWYQGILDFFSFQWLTDLFKW